MLTLPQAQRAELEAFVKAGYPHETCGLLIGRASGGHGDVRRVTQAGNLNSERAHDTYELDPADQLKADRAARAEGLDIIGVWHSHPDHPARPSQRDLAQAWPGWSYVIVRVTKAGVEDLRSWRLPDDEESPQGTSRAFQEEVVHESGNG